MFSMKTHKVISKTIHQYILFLRHEYLLRATCLSPKQPPSLGELSFPGANQPPLKTYQLVQRSKNPPSSEGNYVSLGELCTLAKEVPLFLRPNAFAHTPVQSLFN
jgi:hypothetical protein